MKAKSKPRRKPLDVKIDVILGLIKHQNMTITEFCKAAEIHRSNFYNYINRPNSYTSKDIMGTVRALKIPHELIGWIFFPESEGSYSNDMII